ncbi:MAG: hypothetical protein AAB669_02385 [Patescibacteria group bacterium]
MLRFVCLVLITFLALAAASASDQDKLKIKLDYRVTGQYAPQMGQYLHPGFDYSNFRLTYSRSESFRLTSKGWGSLFYGAAVYDKPRFSTGMFDRANYAELRFLFIPIGRVKIGN